MLDRDVCALLSFVVISIIYHDFQFEMSRLLFLRDRRYRYRRAGR
jgi:hypothetical protein